jgi:hypothetical protein
MATGRDYGALIDLARAACLCHAGAPGYMAAVTVDHEGTEALWLVATEQLDRDDPELGNPNQRHEQLGRLPQVIRDRIWGDALRCGRPRPNGKPCRQRVAEPGQSCGAHGGGEASC